VRCEGELKIEGWSSRRERVVVERMKALQKNQGRTDQMLGAMADVLTSVAMPNQQWVSYNSSLCI